MKRVVVPWLTVLGLLWLFASPLEAQAKKEAKYRGKTARQWLERLNSDQSSVRYAALGAVEALGPKVQAAAVPVLAEMLEDRDPEFRAFAASGLGGLGPRAKSAVPALVALFNDEERDVQNAAIEAVGGIGPGAAEAVPALASLLGGEVDERLERAAISALGEIAPKAKEVLPAVKRAVRRASAAPDTDLAEYQAVFVWLLSKGGPDSASFLMDLFEKTDKEWLRVRIAVALGAMERQAKGIAPRLAKALASRGNRCRAEGAWALWQIDRHPAAIPTLAQVLEEYARQAVRPPASDPPDPYALSPFYVVENGEAKEVSGRVFNAASVCSSLAKLGPDAKAATPVLAKLLSHKSHELRCDAAWALWAIAKHKESIPTLTKCIYYDGDQSDKSKCPQMDRTAIERLGEIGPDAKAALPILRKALEALKQVKGDRNQNYNAWSLRARIQEAVEKIDPGASRKIPNADPKE